MQDGLSLALDGVRIDRVLDSTVEIAEAAPADRRFPDRISSTLGVCLKFGPAHDVHADGRGLSYPANSVCVRTPGCVWSTPATGKAGFLSLDIELPALPQAIMAGGMRFARATELPDLRHVAASLRGTAELLEKQTLVAELVSVLLDRGLVASAELGVQSAPNSARRARDLLLARLANPPSLEELSEAVSANRFVLLRQFRRAFGVPPHSFLVRARVEQARSLLARGADVAEVAHALGFSDQSHFTRAFRGIVGLTPGAYRRMVRASVARR
jgi:AraC-like DNA-binding protein